MDHHLPLHRLSLTLLLGVLGPVAFVLAAQTSSTSESARSPSRYYTSADLVAVNVTVLDESQRLVGGLSPESFELFEDGFRQDLTYFEARDVPLDLVLLIDTSSSMYDKLHAIRMASAAFAGALRAGDRGAVLTFNNHVTSEIPFTTDGRILSAAIRSIKAGGGTSLYESIYVALRGLASGAFPRSTSESGTVGGARPPSERHPTDQSIDERVRRQAIVVLTDGHDTTSLVTFDTLREEARQASVMIYTICLMAMPATGRWERDPSVWEGRLDFNMRELARETGGLLFAVRTDSDLAAAYARITSELTQQYLIAYVSSQKTRTTPGVFRRITVRLRNVPNATPRARSGYVWTSRSAAARLPSRRQ